MGNPANISIGPGLTFVGALDATDPTDATTVLTVGDWFPIGYTESGMEIQSNVTVADVEVAEEADPILSLTTKRTTNLVFKMAEMTSANLALALNQGILTAPTTVEQIDLDDEVRIKIVHETREGARWLFRKCYNTGSLDIQRQKSPNKSLLGVSFRLEIPTGAKPFKVWANADKLV